MKRILVLLIIIVLTLCLSAQDFAVDSTKTMSEDHLESIREAFSPTGSDPAAQHYWQYFIDTPCRSDSTGRDEPTREDSWALSMCKDYSKEAIWGAIGLDMPQTTPPTEPSDKLETVKRFLLDPNYSDYLSYDSLWVNLESYDYSRVVSKTAMMVDMLWYYVSEAQRDSLCIKLAVMADTLHYLADRYVDTWGLRPNNNDNLPQYFCPIGAFCCLGYIGCLYNDTPYEDYLDEDYVDYALEMLFEYPIPYLDESKYGFFDFFTSTAGYISEGLTYFGSNVFDDVDLFMTAYLRTTGINLYNSEIITNTIYRTFNMIKPDMSLLTLDDSYSHLNDQSSSYNFASEVFINGLFEYYYNNTIGGEIDNQIRWYFSQWMNHYPNYAGPPLMHHYTYFRPVYSYNPNKTTSIFTPPGTLPELITNGSYSDEEFTVFRSPISDQADFENSIQMYVNYDNSLSPTYHEHGDQTSYQLYAYGKYLMVDPGYKTNSFANYARNALEWTRSPYAHSLVIVNPDSLKEYLNLAHHYNGDSSVHEDTLMSYYQLKKNEPRYRKLVDPSNPQTISAPNPSYKSYFIKNNAMEHLKIYVDYEIYPHESDVVRNYRNCYFFEKEYFIIVDDVSRLEGTSSDTLWNLLHFKEYTNNSNLIMISDDTFLLSAGYNESGREVNLSGAIGASSPYYIDVDDGMPVGYYYWNWSHNYEHSRLKAVVTDTETKYLTLLVPSDNPSNIPLLLTNNGTGKFILKYEMNDGYVCYAAVNKDNNQIGYSEYDLQFITSAGFLLVETNSDCSEIRKLILNGDNSIEVHDPLTGFDDIVLYDSEYEAEEVMAEWNNEELHVTFKTDENDRPQYRILRCGIEPENLYSKTEFGTYQPGTEPGGERGTIEDNISYLAYDDEYFYVNYDYADLVAGNMLTEDLTIYKGVFDGITIQDVVQFGCGEIVLRDEISVSENGEIVFLSGSHPQLAEDFHLIVDGLLTAPGNEGNHVVFDKYLTNNWYKIEITETGLAELDYCEFRNAQFPLHSIGGIIVENCEFLFNDRGIYLKNPTRYQINNSYIHNCGFFGILLMNSHEPIYRSEIKYSKITGNDYGLWFYNASAVVLSDTIYANKYAGILANRGSNPVVTYSTISYTHYDGTDYPEIKINGTSYPVVEKMFNDIIFGNSYSLYNQDAVTLEYYCRDLWWGTTIENDVEDSFYPGSWVVNYLPIHTTPWVGYDPLAGDGLFSLGLIAESEGDYETASEYYMQSIAENPEGLEAIWSVNRLINCLETEAEYIELQGYFAGLISQYPETKLAETAILEKTFCDRLLGDYQTAISNYEVLLNDELTFIDSIYTELDIVYTYLEASSGGDRAVNINFSNLERQLNSIEQAKEKENNLWILLNNQTKDGGMYSPEITEIELFNNYPNPFNPVTTIAFSLPEEGEIELCVYNVKGQKVKTLIASYFERGKHSIIWNGDDDSGKLAGSGVYFYKLNVNGKTTAVKKCLLLK